MSMKMLNTRAIVMEEFGGAEVLKVRDWQVPPPATGELRLRQSAIGVNFHDIYVRTGLYDTLKLPGVPGLEGVGVIDAISEGVSDFNIGERVGYIDATYGGYGEYKAVSTARCILYPQVSAMRRARPR